METYIRFFLYFVILAALIYFLIYSIRLKSKPFIILASFLLIPTLMLIFMNQIDEVRYNKNDVRADLGFMDVRLNEDFQIVKKDIRGIPKRNHTVKLILDEKDRSRLLEDIQNSENFEVYNSLNEGPESDGFDETIEIVYNSKYPEFYSKHFFHAVETYPIRFRLYIDEDSDTVTYLRFEKK